MPVTLGKQKYVLTYLQYQELQSVLLVWKIYAR